MANAALVASGVPRRPGTTATKAGNIAGPSRFVRSASYAIFLTFDVRTSRCPPVTCAQ